MFEDLEDMLIGAQKAADVNLHGYKTTPMNQEGLGISSLETC